MLNEKTKIWQGKNINFKILFKMFIFDEKIYNLKTKGKQEEIFKCLRCLKNKKYFSVASRNIFYITRLN